MKLSKLLVLISLLGLFSCSGNKKEEEVAAVQEETLDEKILEEDADFIVDSEDEEVVEEAQSEEPVKEVAAIEEEVSEEVVAAGAAPMISDLGEYTVQKGDTLMLIAFRLWGDYDRWKELANVNRESLTNGLQPGVILKYAPNGFSWNPQGLPHLIKRGETLGTISNDKYGTDRRWKDIWDNNKPMIKDPNLIFAGFTLYYIPEEERDLASEEM